MASTSKRSSSVSGTDTTVPPFTSAISRYIVKVGSGITTDFPGPTTTAKNDWISSLEPLATRIPSSGHPVASATAPMKLLATKGG
jgi:hypothetical protein